MKVGKYIAKVKCSNIMEALLNGVSPVYPVANMVYDGKWCKFYVKGKMVFDCNPNFAKYNFELSGFQPLSTSR